jgi:hypothetical protein
MMGGRDLANEGKPVTRVREGRIANEKKESAVRNNNAVMHQQQLADARHIARFADGLRKAGLPQ